MSMNDIAKIATKAIKSSRKLNDFVNAVDGKSRDRKNHGYFDIHLEFEAAIHYVDTAFVDAEYDVLKGAIEQWRIEVNDYYILVVELQRERLFWKVSVEDFD